MCPEQQVCPDYSAGHKRKSHHVRITIPCVRFEDGSCPMVGHSCNLEKIRGIKAKLSNDKKSPEPK